MYIQVHTWCQGTIIKDTVNSILIKMELEQSQRYIFTSCSCSFIQLILFGMLCNTISSLLISLHSSKWETPKKLVDKQTSTV